MPSSTHDRSVPMSDELDALRKENAELRDLLDAIPLAVVIIDRDGRFLYANPAGASGYGRPADQMIGLTEVELFPAGNDLDDWFAKNRQVIDSGEPLATPEQDFRNSEGRLMQLFVIRSAITFAGVPAVMISAYDTSTTRMLFDERRALEHKLAETQRLEGLGLMASGIAHDFNNLLVGVFVNADMALREVGKESRAAGFIGRLKSAAQRLADLSRQMLAYSGRGHVHSENLDVGDVTRELLGLLRASVPAHVELIDALPTVAEYIHADRAQFTQIVMNLVTNAAEAIGERPGRVCVAARREHFDATRLASLTVRARHAPGQYICIEVSDDGPGMDAATRDRIFDPFFTTKATGRGLGLASVIGIVRAHGGALQVDSAVGQGTRMRIWLPAAPARVSVVPSIPSVPVAQRARVALIVDDEPLVREATSSLLDALGFSVLAAEDGEQAVAIAKQAASLDVVFLDMTMPKRSAADTHAALRELRPNLPILLCSGYNDPEVVKALLAQPPTMFIQKPYTMDQLSKTVDALLRRAERAAVVGTT